MQCHLCSDFSAPTFNLLLRHIGRVHAGSADFHLSCGLLINGTRCLTTFTNFHAYKRHLRKIHREVIPMQDEEEHSNRNEEENSDNYSDIHDTSEYSCEDHPPVTSRESYSDRQAALWILRLKEENKLTQSAVDEILSDVTELCSSVVHQLGSELHDVLNSAGLNPNDIP